MMFESKEHRDQWAEQALKMLSGESAQHTSLATECWSTQPPHDEVIDGVIAGSVASIIAPGSTGKGFFTLGLCYDLLTGDNKLGMGIKKVEPEHKVRFFTLEDPKPIMNTRHHALIHHYGLDVKRAREVDDQLRIVSAQGSIPMCLMDSTGTPNYFVADLMIQAFKGCRIVFLDTLARLHSADENNNGHMSMLVQIFEYIAKESGSAIVFLHHTNKGATLNGQGSEAGAVRGASALTDNIRCQINLSKMTEDEAVQACIPTDERHNYLWVHNSKKNYGATNPAKLLKRCNGGALESAKDKENTSEEDYSNG
jgi:RecA-family ATPase